MWLWLCDVVTHCCVLLNEALFVGVVAILCGDRLCDSLCCRVFAYVCAWFCLCHQFLNLFNVCGIILYRLLYAKSCHALQFIILLVCVCFSCVSGFCYLGFGIIVCWDSSGLKELRCKIAEGHGRTGPSVSFACFFSVDCVSWGFRAQINCRRLCRAAWLSSLTPFMCLSPHHNLLHMLYSFRCGITSLSFWIKYYQGH